jgi:glycosyltransferase involved in cell wall biosynthesis
MEKVALTLMKGLQDRGHEVFCVASGWTDGDFPARLTHLGIPYDQVYLGKITKRLHPKYLWWMTNTLIHWPWAYRRVRRLLSDFRPDVVLLYQPDHLILIHGLLKRQRCLFHVHGLGIPGFNRPWLLRWADAPVARYAAVSRFVQEDLLVRGVALEKTCVIYNGLDSPPVSPAAAEAPRGPDGPARVGIVGQVGAWKGHLDFVEALALLAKKGLAFEGHIFGDGSSEFKADLRRKIEALGLGGRITWHGYVKDMEAIYVGLDVIAMPSVHEEPFGLIPCEAGLRGLPAVVTRRGGLPEIVEEGVTGFIVEAQRPDQLADRLERLIRDPALGRAMGEKARLRIAECFSQERMVAEFEALCRELAAHA